MKLKVGSEFQKMEAPAMLDDRGSAIIRTVLLERTQKSLHYSVECGTCNRICNGANFQTFTFVLHIPLTYVLIPVSRS